MPKKKKKVSVSKSSKKGSVKKTVSKKKAVPQTKLSKKFRMLICWIVRLKFCIVPAPLNFQKKGKRSLKILKRYPSKQSCIMPVLHLAQEEKKWLSPQVMQGVAAKLGLPVSQIWRVATFYSMYLKKPVGKFHLQVCRTLSCELNGARQLLELVKQKYNLSNGQTSPDGLFTISEVECLGACGTAPVVQINHEYYEKLTPKTFAHIMELLKKIKFRN